MLTVLQRPLALSSGPWPTLSVHWPSPKQPLQRKWSLWFIVGLTR